MASQLARLWQGAWTSHSDAGRWRASSTTPAPGAGGLPRRLGTAATTASASTAMPTGPRAAAGAGRRSRSKAPAWRWADRCTRGANLTGRLGARCPAAAASALQAYYDHSKREVPPTFTETLDIADLQVQHRFAPMGAHSVVGARITATAGTASPTASVSPSCRRSEADLGQPVCPGRDRAVATDLRLTLGSRFERNPYTGTEIPADHPPVVERGAARLLGTACLAYRARALAARRRCLHSRAPPYLLRGGPTVRSEVAKVFELGYRGQPLARLSYSVTLFHNEYDHLRTQEMIPAAPDRVRQPDGRAGRTASNMWGSFQASEMRGACRPADGAARAFSLKPGSNDVGGRARRARIPAHTVQLRSNVQPSTAARTGSGAAQGGGAGESPSAAAMSALDARSAGACAGMELVGDRGRT
jgi:iron complex outermembrane receptor protein